MYPTNDTLTNQINIRPVMFTDMTALKEIIRTSGLFPSDLLDEMTNNYFSHPDSTTDIWLTLTLNETPLAIAYCAPEKLTEGTYNLYLIAVHKAGQGKGIGKQLLRYIEGLLEVRGNRILLVETSGLPEFALTRKFYEQCGYQQEAVIQDFYRTGDAKIIFTKRLNKQ